MGAGENISTKILSVKQFSTKTFSSISSKLLRIQFVKRNKKVVIVCLIFWLVINLGGFLIYRNNTAGMKDDFYQNEVSATQSLSVKTAPSLLEKDMLSLNVAIREFSQKENVAFVAILDHKMQVIAHSDPEMVNRPLMSLQNMEHAKTIDGILIETGKGGDDQKPLISFSKDIEYSGVKIGRVYYVISSIELNKALSRFRMTLLMVLVVTSILLAVGLVFTDRISRAKAAKIRKEFEGMNKIGPYLLTQQIAKGGMADLFLSDYLRQDGFRRTVAVKKILPHLAENQDFIKMFIREARLAALLQHPNIVQIIDFGKIQNVYLIAMEYIDGKNLAEIMAHVKQGLPVDLSVFVIMKICTDCSTLMTKRMIKAATA